MLASLLRPKGKRKQIDRSPFSSPFTGNSPWLSAAARRGPRNLHEAGEVTDENDFSGLHDIDEDIDENWTRDEDEEEDPPLESTPLLPIFSASHLGKAHATIGMPRNEC